MCITGKAVQCTNHLQKPCCSVFFCLSLSLSLSKARTKTSYIPLQEVSPDLVVSLSICLSISLSLYLCLSRARLPCTAPFVPLLLSSPEGDSSKKHPVLWQDIPIITLSACLLPSLPSPNAAASRPWLADASSNNTQSVASSGEGQTWWWMEKWQKGWPIGGTATPCPHEPGPVTKPKLRPVCNPFNISRAGWVPETF